MQNRPYPKWISRLFLFAVTMLAFTGLLQMPLAKRYALTTVPGMAWTGDFFMVHRLHYLFAALLLFVVALVAVNWMLQWRDKLTLTRLGLTRVVILAGILVSGGLRVYRNLPDVTLPAAAVVTIEWVHIVLVMVLGVVALVALIKLCSAYARWK